MNYMGKNSISYFMKLSMIIGMIVGIIVLFTLPWLLKMLGNTDFVLLSDYAYRVLLIVLYPAGIVVLIILKQLYNLFFTLEKEDPFIKANVRALNNISICMAVLMLIFVIKMIFLNSIMTIIITMILALAAICCLILARVFDKAVEYKLDNDLTI